MVQLTISGEGQKPPLIEGSLYADSAIYPGEIVRKLPIKNIEEIKVFKWE
ncbi:hypothetical protein GCM10011351_09510 [Paraliobacillus quinghaiensis]|uniref:Uncharacterized protein n=1 Tax=Paraliobacillus quinghaiensis TaxID=470815 RepID=A0A917TM31_9BACI|nr:hypothetical protein GCM10011351_09510 [Paraliobacillus quinghaiensis]